MSNLVGSARNNDALENKTTRHLFRTSRPRPTSDRLFQAMEAEYKYPQGQKRRRALSFGSSSMLAPSRRFRARRYVSWGRRSRRHYRPRWRRNKRQMFRRIAKKFMRRARGYLSRAPKQIGWIESANNAAVIERGASILDSSFGQSWGVTALPIHNVAQGTLDQTNVRTGWVVKFYKTQIRVYQPPLWRSIARSSLGMSSFALDGMAQGLAGLQGIANYDSWTCNLGNHIARVQARHYLVAVKPGYAVDPTNQQLVDDFVHFGSTQWQLPGLGAWSASGPAMNVHDATPRIDKRFTEFKSKFRIIKKWKTYWKPGKPQIHEVPSSNTTPAQGASFVKGLAVTWHMPPRVKKINIRRLLYQTYDGAAANALENPFGFFILTHYVDAATSSLNPDGFFHAGAHNNNANDYQPGGYTLQWRSYFRAI